MYKENFTAWRNINRLQSISDEEIFSGKKANFVDLEDTSWCEGNDLKKLVCKRTIEAMPPKYGINDGRRQKLYYLFPPKLWFFHRKFNYSKRREAELWHLANQRKLLERRYEEEEKQNLELNVMLYECSEAHETCGERGNPNRYQVFGIEMWMADISEDKIVLRSEGLHPEKEEALDTDSIGYPFIKITDPSIWDSPRTVIGYNMPRT